MRAYKNTYEQGANKVIIEDCGKEMGITLDEAFRLVGELIAAANEVIKEQSVDPAVRRYSLETAYNNL